MKALRLAGATALALAALCVQAPLASATFHLMQIREVYAGSSANPGSEYVELQMWAPDQNLVGGHFLRTYDAAGNPTGTDSFTSDVPRGADQSTIVLATPEAEAELGFAADAAIAPSGRLDPGGGAVCWENLDCVAWGVFSGAGLPSASGVPFAGPIPDGMALRRTIAPGCPTLLEPGDDHDSGADFSPVFPGPRPNSTLPSERPCSPADGGGSAGGGGPAPGGAAAGHGPPQTLLGRKPSARTRDRTPTFRFHSDDAGARFECKLDGRRYRACRSPFTLRPLAVGTHRFRVRAVHDGIADPSPAQASVEVLPPRR